MEQIPNTYKWLLEEDLPPTLKLALSFYGVSEYKGKADNPVIIEWSKEIEHSEYEHDSRAWCGLFMAMIMKRLGHNIPDDPFRALHWIEETSITEPILGDILIFKKTKISGHIGFYIGETENTYHVLGGNQHDKVSIIPMWKWNLDNIKRPSENNEHLTLGRRFLLGDGRLKGE